VLQIVTIVCTVFDNKHQNKTLLAISFLGFFFNETGLILQQVTATFYHTHVMTPVNTILSRKDYCNKVTLSRYINTD